jgi:tetratricopeptide (TPR) repeat protein
VQEQAPAEPEPEPAAEMTPPAPPEPEPEPQPEPKAQPPTAPPEREAYREPVTRSRSGMTGMLSSVQNPDLTQAQNELTRGNIPGAMESYGKLIKKGKLLDEIIFDLREAIYRYPVEVTILQTLGDAYMRANRLQDALDAYTKAEELLR